MRKGKNAAYLQFLFFQQNPLTFQTNPLIYGAFFFFEGGGFIGNLLVLHRVHVNSCRQMILILTTLKLYLQVIT